MLLSFSCQVDQFLSPSTLNGKYQAEFELRILSTPKNKRTRFTGKFSFLQHLLFFQSIYVCILS